MAKVREELEEEKERTGKVKKKTISDIKKRYEKDHREELDKHKEMFRTALSRAQIAEKKVVDKKQENDIQSNEIARLNVKICELVKANKEYECRMMSGEKSASKWKEEKVELNNREQLGELKEMLSRAQIAEKKLEEAQVELAKFKDLNHVATMQIKVLNNKIYKNKEGEVHVLQALNQQVREEKEVLQVEISAQEEQNKRLCVEKEVLQAEVAALQEKANLADVLSAEVSLSRHLTGVSILRY